VGKLRSEVGLHVVVVGAGAAGLSASWLLSKENKVTLVEQEPRLGGHAHSAFVNNGPSNADLTIDTGFIVYNELNYPNLVAWFKAMGVTTEDSNMSFAVSRDDGGFEYAGGPKLGLFVQPSLMLGTRFWRMLKDLLRFYKEAPNQIPEDSTLSLNNMLDYPAAAFIRFCDNHGLLKLSGRPQWRTVTGGSHHYVSAAKKTIESNDGDIRTDAVVSGIDRHKQGVTVTLTSGDVIEADHVVIATHADTALSLINSPDASETDLLSRFEYDKNHAVLHSDLSLMPKRKKAWCSWNYVEQENDDKARVSVSYWMNRLQNLKTERDYFVSLNPGVAPRPETAVQAGFAVAEQLGGEARPWNLENPSDRIVVTDKRLWEKAVA